ncbi:hypothetical protein JMJ35_005053 [Cladonia borealis]|uniref:Ankyrin repeat protein n=1 Tax=Cladonia borealis TaxID=184061 RepID=A0AA39R404_9LECA|nr:hypothetical protein JMJ35_005053 [Cladonia borealis]
MADPISVISLIEGSIGLVLQCGSVAKTLSDIIAKSKHAEVAIISLIQEVETIQYAWSRIKEWSEDHAEAATDSQFVQRLDKSLQCGTLVLSALEQDLAEYKYTADNASFVLRSKMAWNERAFLDHQHRVRGQVQAMTLLLQVSQLSASKAQIKLLKKKEKAFHASDESAYSIVPSRLSSHMSMSTRSQDSILTIESQELVYFPLSFEDELFTARVYKRNYRNPLINCLVKLHRRKKREEKRVPTANPEASEDGDSLLSSSTGTITQMGMSVDVSQPWPWSREIPRRDVRPVSPGPALTAETKAGLTDLERSVMVSGSVPYSMNGSPGIGSGPHYGTIDSSIQPIYSAGGQPDISDAISPAPRQFTQKDSEPNEEIERTSPAPQAQKKLDCSLLEAIDKGDLNEVKTLISHGAQVNTHHSRHHSLNAPPLHLAVCKRDVSMTELLLEQGADYEHGWRGRPPIHQACKDADFQITRLLLGAGASATSLDSQQEQPLHKLLSIRLPTFEASKLIELLVSRGANINARTRTNETPLHLSCKNLNVDSIRAILVHGPNMDAQDRAGNTPFHSLVIAWSAWRRLGGFESISRVLLQHGVNVDAQNRAGDTPLHILVKVKTRLTGHFEYIGYEDAIRLFLRFKANANAQDRLGNTPLHVLASVWNGYHNDIQLLLEHGVNVNAKNKVGDTPFHVLVTKMPIYEAIKPFLEHGVNVNAQNKVGDTPLHILLIADVDHYWTVERAVIQTLIKHGAQVNIQNVAGDTPFHMLSRLRIKAEWKRQLLWCLLDAGADVSVKNLKGESPLQLLEQADDSSIVRQVEQAMPVQEIMSEGDEEEIGVAS